MLMKALTVRAIGIIEILTGLSAIICGAGAQLSSITEMPSKPVNVFIFVTLAGIVSVALGTGLILGKRWARILLAFFSGYIILTKGLIYAGLLSLNGSDIFRMFSPLHKDMISTIYHTAVILTLTVRRGKQA